MWKLNGKKHSAGTRFQGRHMRADMRAIGALTPAYALVPCQNPRSPLILASPHSGRTYPQGFLDQTNLPLSQLRLPEDSFVDEILMPLTKFGVPLLHALFPRCYVDVNRSADEIPPENLPKNNAFSRTSPRAHMGLGVIPTHISQGVPIYPRPLSAKQIETRLAALYRPYHNALSDLIEATKTKFGHTVLLDCHSMPGHAVSGKNRADFILGDRFGESCHPDTTNFLHDALETLGYSVTRNIPYAGGYITSHYGRPSQNVQAIQIEINKDLYLNHATLEPHDGMAQLTTHMQTVILALSNQLNTPDAIAAQ